MQVGSDRVHFVTCQVCTKSDISVFYKRLAKKRGKGRVAVAAASKLPRVIYWMLKERRAFVTSYSQDVNCDEVIEGQT